MRWDLLCLMLMLGYHVSALQLFDEPCCNSGGTDADDGGVGVGGGVGVVAVAGIVEVLIYENLKLVGSKMSKRICFPIRDFIVQQIESRKKLHKEFNAYFNVVNHIFYYFFFQLKNTSGSG